jgi:hypothetical protein
MDSSVEKQRLEAISKLAVEIETCSDNWLFPKEKVVRGFFGIDPIVIVGDQPSKSLWNESHPHRRIYYDTLEKVGATNAHLTDLYKRRGESSSLEEKIPDDFAQHLEFFKRELDIVKPTRIVALGQLAYKLLQANLPGLKDLGQVWHFAYVYRSGKSHLYEAQMRRAIWKEQID